MRPDPGVIFVLFIVAVIGLAAVAYGVLLFARWQANRIRYVTPARARAYARVSAEQRIAPVLAETGNGLNSETPEFDAEIRAELICFGETQALARLLVEEKIGLTDAVKIGAAAKSGEKYQKRSRDIKAAVERLKEPEYPTLASQQRPSIVERN